MVSIQTKIKILIQFLFHLFRYGCVCVCLTDQSTCFNVTFRQFKLLDNWNWLTEIKVRKHRWDNEFWESSMEKKYFRSHRRCCCHCLLQTLEQSKMVGKQRSNKLAKSQEGQIAGMNTSRKWRKNIFLPLSQRKIVKAQSWMFNWSDQTDS